MTLTNLKMKETTMLTDQQRDDLIARSPAEIVTPEKINALIGAVAFWRPYENATLTICVLTLENGFQVTGQSACANPDNFDAELGKKIAYDNAFNKIWELEGYLLKQSLYLNSAAAMADPVTIASAEAVAEAQNTVVVENESIVESVAPVTPQESVESAQPQELVEAAGIPAEPVDSAAVGHSPAEQTPEAQPSETTGEQEAA